MVLLLLLTLHHGDPIRAWPRSIQDDRRNKHDVHHHDKAAAALSMPTAAVAQIDAADETRIRVVVILLSFPLDLRRRCVGICCQMAKF